jgi:hypothetical protein
MWPFGRKGVVTRLTGLEERTEVEILGTVLSGNAAVSPITGERGAIVHLEVLERIRRDKWERRTLRASPDRDDSLGELIFGELVMLRDEEGTELSFVARRARFRFSNPRRDVKRLPEIPPDLVPHLRRTTGEGVLLYREHIVREGDALRLQAIVEPAQHAAARGYRSTPRTTFVTRDDVAPVFLEG